MAMRYQKTKKVERSTRITVEKMTLFRLNGSVPLLFIILDVNVIYLLLPHVYTVFSTDTYRDFDLFPKDVEPR